MSDIKHRDQILEAIDQLRRRKARPDIHRICNFLMRKFSINSVDAKIDLQKCVEKEIVLKVEYKGSISYRNASKKFSHVKQEGDNISSVPDNKPNRKFVALLTNAIAELIVYEPDYLEVGVPGSELIKNILSKDNVRYTKKYAHILLEKEVENGGLVKMENGNYLVGPTKNESSTDNSNSYDSIIEKNEGDISFVYKKKEQKSVKLGVKKGKMEIEHSDEFKNFRPNENGILRVGSRRKRAKKVFDPSDNNLPKKRGRPIGSLNRTTIEKQLSKFNDSDSRSDSCSSTGNREQGGVCSVCHNNKKIPNDRLVACRECSNKAHITCLNGDDMMLKMYPDNTWQCPHCKTCCVCYETSDAGSLTICYVCADAYHSGCHDPPVSEKIKGGMKWLCFNCQMPEQLQVTEIHPNVSSSDIFTHKDTSNDWLLGMEDKDIFRHLSQKLQGWSNSRKITDEKRSISPVLSISEDSTQNSIQHSPPSPTLSPQAINLSANASPDMKCNLSDSQSVKDLDIDELIDPSIPDASHWSYDDVYNYFVRYFPEEAKVFKEQEIDGRSLLLMKRMDVISSLKLELGTALKIYRHVVKLQFRRDDPKLYWL